MLWHDLRYGIRMLFKRPCFTAMAILTLALGIGLNAAIFSIYDTVILRPLPVRDPSRVVNLYSAIRGERQTNSFSYPEYAYYRDNNSIFSGMVAYAGAKVLLGGPDASSAQAAQPEWLHTQLVSGNYFDLLGASPALGRTFLPEEDKTPATHPVVVLSYSFWQSRLGADPAIIGRFLNLNSLPYTVIGIAPKGFIGTDPDVPDAWVPVMMSANVHSGPSLLDDREAGWVFVVGRLKPGVTLRQSQAEMEVLAGRFHVADKDRQRQSTVVVTPSGFLSPSQQSDVVPFAVLIMVAVGLVLLIACTNVANLQLVRAVSRQKEMGIRLSLGASRGRLIRQLLAESLLLSAIAGVAGLFVGWWAASLFVSFMHPPGEKALSLQIALDRCSGRVKTQSASICGRGASRPCMKSSASLAMFETYICGPLTCPTCICRRWRKTRTTFPTCRYSFARREILLRPSRRCPESCDPLILRCRRRRSRSPITSPNGSGRHRSARPFPPDSVCSPSCLPPLVSPA
jgi:predicted permease